MIAYQLDQDGFYIGEVKCQLDPLATEQAGEDVFLLPRGAVTYPPPAEEPFSARRWLNGQWNYVPDYRNIFVYHLADRLLIETYGAIPDGWSLEVTPEWLAYEESVNFKGSRDHQLSIATVTVNGNIYDADEVSRSRLMSAIEAATFLNSTSIPFWKMADNEVVENIPLSEIREAHAQIVLYMAQIWLPPT